MAATYCGKCDNNCSRRRKYNGPNASQRTWNRQPKRTYLSLTIFQQWKEAKMATGQGKCSDNGFIMHLLSLQYCGRYFRKVMIEDGSHFTGLLDNNSVTWEHQDLAQVKIKVLRGHLDSVNSCQFFENDTRVLSASNDQTVRIWATESGKQLCTYDGHCSFVTNCHVDLWNKRMVSGGWDKQMLVRDVATGQILWQASHEGVITSCNYSSDGKYIVSGGDMDFSISLWDAKDGALIRKLKYNTNTITSCKFSPKQHRISVTSMDKTTRIIDVSMFKDEYTVSLTLRGHGNVISDASFSNDERILATASWDKNIQLWDVSSGTYRKTGPVTLKKGHEGSVSSCCFSADDQMLVSSSLDQNLVVWDVTNSVQKFSLKGHNGWVNDAAFSKDQKWVLSCSQDKTIRLWNIENLDELPVVLEHKKNMGLRIIECRKCEKQFSITQVDNAENNKLCVFCRLETRTLP